MARKHGSVMIGMAVAAVLLAGCGADLNTLTTSGLSALDARGAVTGAPGAAGRAGFDKGGIGRGLFQNDLNLTDEQKTQLQTIADKYKPAQAAPTDLRSLLTGETVDADALRTALEAGQTAHQAQHASRLAMQSEIRAVYTEEQRTAIIAKLQAQPEPVARDKAGRIGDRPDMAARFAETLQLSDAQKAALDALKPVDPAVRPDPAAHRQAEIAFWQTGDTTQLQALAPAFVDKTDAIVTAATTLTVDQRKAVFSHGFGGPGLGGPGMGGREFGGHGGKGPGGRPGMGPQGMGRGPAGIGGGFGLPV